MEGSLVDEGSSGERRDLVRGSYGIYGYGRCRRGDRGKGLWRVGCWECGGVGGQRSEGEKEDPFVIVENEKNGGGNGKSMLV